MSGSVSVTFQRHVVAQSDLNPAQPFEEDWKWPTVADNQDAKVAKTSISLGSLQNDHCVKMRDRVKVSYSYRCHSIGRSVGAQKHFHHTLIYTSSCTALIKACYLSHSRYMLSLNPPIAFQRWYIDHDHVSFCMAIYRLSISALIANVALHF